MLRRVNRRNKLNRQDRQRGLSVVELLVAILVVSVIAGMAIPGFLAMVRTQRISGDARDINGAIALAKMRAAADFTQARLYADLDAQRFRIQVWSKPVPPAATGSWSSEGGTQSLSQGVSLGFGALGTPPAGTQATIGQAPACLNNTGGLIARTACVVFNSRGIPVDSTGAPTANDAIYITDGNSVHAVTVAATGLIRTWRTDATAAGWQKR